jgi:pimeloyl-ACP methyl ester carboxylesterase
MKRAGLIVVLASVIAAAVAWIAVPLFKAWLNRPLPAPAPTAGPRTRLPDYVSLPGYVRNGRRPDLLVFLHGFSSSARDAWLHESGAYWPLVFRDDARFGGFDIYVAGYPTCSAAEANPPLGTLHEWVARHLNAAGVPAYDRITIVAHSMGGLIARGMILNDASGTLKRRLAGVYFMGTPGRGTPKADALARFAGRCGAGQASDLAVASNYIQFSNSLWRTSLEEAPPAFQLGCVAEGKPLKGISTIGPVVPYESVAANCLTGAELLKDEDHFDIAKVADGADAQHVWLSDRILRSHLAMMGLPVPSGQVVLLPGTFSPRFHMLTRPPRLAEISVEITMRGASWRRVDVRRTFKTLQVREGIAEGALQLAAAAEGRRLSNFSARCVSRCETATPGDVRWIGLTSRKTAARGGAGIRQRVTGGPPPIWELTADEEAPLAELRPVPESQSIDDLDEFQIRIPDGSLSAVVRLTPEGGSEQRFDFSKGISGPFERVFEYRQGDGVYYRLRWQSGR